MSQTKAQLVGSFVDTSCLTKYQWRSVRSFYRWDEEAHQANNTKGWVLETPPAPAEPVEVITT